MKKGIIVFVLSSVMFAITILGFSMATICPADGVNSSTGCVCGHSPSSALGFGQVIIGGFTPAIISCNNMADGVCPEDFMDPSTGITANCSNCIDDDCTVAAGSVSGHVKDSNNRPIDKVVVTSHPIKWNGSASLENNVTTDVNGFFNFSGAVRTGSYYFSASKDTYDTQLVQATIVRGKSSVVDFTLLNGTCHEDCTNSYNRCNAACDGVKFADGNSCKFYNSTIKDDCNNRMKGTEVYLGQASSDTAWFVKCCGDQPAETPYTKYYTKASTDNGNIKNLIKVEKIAKYNDVPVRVVIAYWQP